MQNAIYTPRRILITVFSIIAALTTLTIYANQKGGYAEDINPDGSGWKTRWLYNEEDTASATTAVSKWTVWNGTRVSSTAGVSANSIDSTGKMAEGAYFMTIAPYKQDNGPYEGSLSKGISRALTDFFKSPKGTSGRSRAEVRPDRDSGANPGELVF